MNYDIGKIKKGDRLKCVDMQAHGSLIEGNKYIALGKCYGYEFDSPRYVKVINKNGNRQSYFSKRFIKQLPIIKLSKYLNDE